MKRGKWNNTLRFFFLLNVAYTCDLLQQACRDMGLGEVGIIPESVESCLQLIQQ